MNTNQYFIILSFTLVIIMGVVSCHSVPRQDGNTANNQINDTTRAIQIAIDSIILSPRLYGTLSLITDSPFKDTVLVLKNEFSYKYISKKYKIKVLDQDSIYRLSLKTKGKLTFPTILEFNYQKIDDTHSVVSVKSYGVGNGGPAAYIGHQKVEFSWVNGDTTISITNAYTEGFKFTQN